MLKPFKQYTITNAKLLTNKIAIKNDNIQNHRGANCYIDNIASQYSADVQELNAHLTIINFDDGRHQVILDSPEQEMTSSPYNRESLEETITDIFASFQKPIDYTALDQVHQLVEDQLNAM